MGGITEPVVGSGSCPAWIARVSKCLSSFVAIRLGLPVSRIGTAEANITDRAGLDSALPHVAGARGERADSLSPA
jgi:hypothetical protein